MIGNENAVMRLLQYKDTLKKLKGLGFSKVFSDNLADTVGVSPSLVRKDFSLFDISGHKRGGYRIDNLVERLDQILGRNVTQKVIIVGAGKLGSALMNFRAFEEEHIQIMAAFDHDETKQDAEAKIPVLPMEALRGYITKNQIQMGILTLPEDAAQRVADIMILAGIRGILNFSPLQLRAPRHCIIRNVNLELELEHLIYLISRILEDESASEEDSGREND
jgi:redox-sensing transcriptional repressor